MLITDGAFEGLGGDLSPSSDGEARSMLLLNLLNKQSCRALKIPDFQKILNAVNVNAKQRPDAETASRLSSHCASSPRQAVTPAAYAANTRACYAARPVSGFQVARQQIRRIGLQQQTFRRDRRQQLAQLQSPPLIANPTGNTDKQAQIQVPCTSLRLPVKQCSTAPGSFSPGAGLQRQKPIVGVAAVQKHRYRQPSGQRQLALERHLLLVRRGKSG